MKIDILCYGEIDIDNYIEVENLPSTERAAFPTRELYNVGGGSANTAIWLANWGVQTRLVGNPIGQDEHGDLIMGWFAEYDSLDVRYVEQLADVTTPICRALVLPDGERAFLLYWINDVAMPELTIEMLADASYLALDVSGPVPPRLEAAKVARSADIPIVINDTATPDHPILPLADYVIISGAYVREHFPDKDLHQLVKDLQSVSSGSVIMTDGPRELFAVDRDGKEYRVQPPTINPVDATGAGDAFKSGVLYGLVNNLPFEATLRFGTASGALKVERAGATANPATLDEVQSLASTLSTH